MAGRTLYISDLDGTLLNADKEVSEYSKDILNRLIRGGVHFSIATARTAASAVKILSGLEITEPVVLMNWAVLYDIRRSRYLKTEVIPGRTVCSLLDVFKGQKCTGFMYAISGERLVTFYENLDTKARKDFHDERVSNYYKTFERVDCFRDKARDCRIVYFSLIDAYERLSPVAACLGRCPDVNHVLYKDNYADDLWYLEICSIHASKFKTVRYLCEKYGFDRVVGFGDNYNDIPLFEACDECYAVSNAVEALKLKATGTVDDNDSDGVARFIADREGLAL